MLPFRSDSFEMTHLCLDLTESLSDTRFAPASRDCCSALFVVGFLRAVALISQQHQGTALLHAGAGLHSTMLLHFVEGSVLTCVCF